MAARAGVAKRRVSSVLASPKEIPSMSFLEELFGDEFPGAFTGDKSRTAKKCNKNILDLPAELLAIICEDLSKLDIKRLRLASKYLAANVDLRIQRVYISPNRANLDCLQKILDHPRYRHQVLEIIWDEAQLEEFPDLDSFRNAIAIDEKNTRSDIEHMLKASSLGHHDDSAESAAFEHDDFFDESGRLTDVAKGIILRFDNQVSRAIIAKNATVMSIEDSYKIYQMLYWQEQGIMKQGFDEIALRHVLAMCPNLETVILTSEVWRPWHLEPVFHTPFYRSLPPGFRKPSVWPWLGQVPSNIPFQGTSRRNTNNRTISDPNEALPRDWRGYSIVVSTLISTLNPQISEFIIYAGNETTGISHQLFATPNLDFTNTMTMAQTLPLKRLKLSINSFGGNWDYTTGQTHKSTYLTSTQLHAFLSATHNLEHLDLSLNTTRRRSTDHIDHVPAPIQNIIPHALLPRLKFLALRNALVDFTSLFNMFCAMTSAQHINLDNIKLTNNPTGSDTYMCFFQQLKAHYARDQTSNTRPAFWLIEPFEAVGGRCPARMVCEELNAYLQHDEAAMPFEERMRNGIRDGVGWVVDDRDEEFLVRGCEYRGVLRQEVV
ncbi:hypothetical protein GQ44DRAFT_617171 [Phaeosphaeriaceae sp. PMI808]|nr:hypothetical protein GQ44DRAFT_617171 [Phaeosphaeriaceae sp. PMI808]